MEKNSVIEGNILATILKQYDPRDVFNVGKSDLLNLRTEDNIAQDKNSLTYLFICNATGDYKQIIAIGQNEYPQLDRNVLPIKYFHNKRGCLTMEIWNEILQQLNEQMKNENRKICLFVDYAIRYNIIEEINNVELYLLANTICLISLNQRIIDLFISNYMEIIFRKQILLFGTDQSASMNLLKTLQYAKHAWYQVDKMFIMECFEKAKFMLPDKNIFNEDEYAFIDDDEKLVDDSCQEDINTDEEMDGMAQNEEEKNISLKEVINALDVLRTYARQKELDIDDIEKFEEKVCKVHIKGVIE